MITNILVAIISLGIWGKASKESQEKTRKASWLRTALYFVLSVIVGIVFYKTYQVSINENNVAVYKIFGTVNEQGENCDTAQIHITHRFNKDQYKDSLEYEDYVTHGGVQVNVISRPWGPKKVNMKYLPDTFEWLEMLDAWNVIPSTNAMTKVLERMHDAYDTNPELADVLYRYKSGMPLTSKEIDMLKLKIDYILSDYRHLLLTRYYVTQPNSLLPWVINDTREEPKLEDYGSDNYGFMVSMESRLDSIYAKKRMRLPGKQEIDWGRPFKATNMQNTILYTYLFGHSDLGFRDIPELEKYKLHEEVSRRDMKTNSVNFLTAADLSQCIYEVCINSDIPLEVLKIDFDIPVEISDMFPEPDEKSMREMVFYDREKLDIIQHQKIKFHAKFPTLENQQLIRSLILTTILTAVVSLFCSNLYFCIRRCSLRYLRKRKSRTGSSCSNLNSVPMRYRKRMLWYKYTCITVYSLLVLLVLYLFIRLLLNDPVSFTSSEAMGVLLKVIAVVVAFVLFLALANRLLTPRK